MFAIMLPVLFLADRADYPNARLLIETEALAKPDSAKAFRVLDARPKAQYLAGHIPGAVWVDATAWSKAVAEKPGEGWADRLAGVGITPKTAVAVYADDIRDAARIWWILRFAGVSEARLLNGGWSAWVAEKHEVEKKENAATTDPADWKMQRDRLSTIEDVVGILKAKSAQLLDARSDGEFCGETKSAKRSGAIPGAIHFEWTDLLDPKTKKFKPAGALTKLIDERKVDLDKPVVTYCQSGGRAAVLAFGMELMGGKQVRNYYRSWAEWGNSDDTPVENGKR
jgi:thiosulfate/3-mercaptopyruvate sulfurtransferase